MLTKRTFLAGAGALLAYGPRGLRAEVEATTLMLETASIQLRPERNPTETLRFAASGPPLHPTPGSPAGFILRNTTLQTTSFQWQGLRGLAVDSPDCKLLEAVAAGGARPFSVPLRDAGTLLLRAAPSPTQAAGRGAQTVIVNAETEAPEVDHDIVVQLADWLVAADGSLRFGSVPPGDSVARIVTVNGQKAPMRVSAAPRARCRLRFVNTSVQRILLVTCAGARPSIVAIDGQPSELFSPVSATFPIGPGARYDLLLDLPETAEAVVRFALKPVGPGDAGDEIVTLRATGAALPLKPPLKPLPSNPALPKQIPLEAAKRIDLTIAGRPGTGTAPPQGWTVNGVGGTTATGPVLTARQGAAVTLGLFNTSPIVVPLRVDGQAVRLLHAKDDGWEPYWRDTVLLPPGSRNHVAFVADIPGHFAISSGFDDLTLAGLSCWFAVTPS